MGFGEQVAGMKDAAHEEMAVGRAGKGERAASTHLAHDDSISPTNYTRALPIPSSALLTVSCPFHLAATSRRHTAGRRLPSLELIEHENVYPRVRRVDRVTHLIVETMNTNTITVAIHQ